MEEGRKGKREAIPSARSQTDNETLRVEEQEEGRLKDKFAFFEAYKNPRPKRRKLLAKRPFLYKQKMALFKNPFKLEGEM